ncbi:uncharacterized protein A1O9_02021 [Exophiala aquamarina CBS 119918]|uniref:TLC domain-containing protein n=1 Tax=Exophiala aquamarina CBS 119918 TaxID=1182545 RepID=A0A072PXY4_9EURO|nr:uncharacterized protein A1O9_02021 [Exophiala aquamarina CBS 119918]KEF60460.1 hypothetical protein A1O9_02021 [Exophiala aquamarina CBS 119918]
MADTSLQKHFNMASLRDQEKLERVAHPQTDHRQHNVSPQKRALLRWQQKGKEKSSIALACTWVVDHQITISLNFISILFLIHLVFPSAQHHTQKFFRISYFNPATGTYALGWDDIFFVFYWTVVFTGLRCAVMDYLLTPLASLLGIKKKKPKVRFAEQAWIFIYPSFSWSVGMYIIYNSDYWLDLRALWRNWPIREMDGLAKWYYLVQFGFWLQQIVVVNIEERRKDYHQMFTHHVITCILMLASYGYHQSRVGTLILCLMDSVDIILPLAKILKYLHFNVACDIAFGIFIVTWFITRHALYMTVLYSIYSDIPQEIQYGCYKGSVQKLQGPLPVPNDWDHLTQPFRDPEGLVCWNNSIKWVFLWMLAALQVVLLVWFIMIVRVAYKVVTGKGAEDVRSDDEEEEEEEEETMANEKKPLIDNVHTCVESQPFLEKEVLSTDPGFSVSKTASSPRRSKQKSKSSSSSLVRTSSAGSSSSTSRKSYDSAHASGINLLAGSSDRKELLGRIGCDKGSTSD